MLWKYSVKTILPKNLIGILHIMNILVLNILIMIVMILTDSPSAPFLGRRICTTWLLAFIHRTLKGGLLFKFYP